MSVALPRRKLHKNSAFLFGAQFLSWLPYADMELIWEKTHRLRLLGVLSYEFNGYWEDLGRPDDYARASKDFETMREQFLPNGCGELSYAMENPAFRS